MRRYTLFWECINSMNTKITYYNHV
jgi:hypothetical protein